MRGRKAGHGKRLIFGFKYFLNQRFVFQDFDLSPLAKSWSGWQSQSDRASREGGGSRPRGRERERRSGGCRGEAGVPGSLSAFPLPPARLVQGVHLLPVLLQCHRHKGRSECGELGGHRPQGRGGSSRRAPPQGSPGAQTLAARARQRCPGSWPAWSAARGLRHVRRTPHPALV